MHPIHLRLLFGCALATLLCSCAATSVQKTWKSPEHQSGPISKLAVLTVADMSLLRPGFENRFVHQLRKGGADAKTTYDLLSLEEIQKDKPAAAERFRAAGAEAVLILRLADATSAYREVRSGDERYMGVTTGLGTTAWYDYYTVAFRDLSPTYGSLKQRVYLEAHLFNLQNNKRIWCGTTRTTFTEGMDRVAEMDPIVEKILNAMRKDAVIP